MGAAEATRAGVAAYRDTVNQTAAQIAGSATKLEQAVALVSSGGPIGKSTNPDLMQARAFLAMAWTSARKAAQHARQSREPVQAFANRMFPG